MGKEIWWNLLEIKVHISSVGYGSFWLELGEWVFVGKSTQGEAWVCGGELVSAGGTPGRILPGEWNDEI